MHKQTGEITEANQDILEMKFQFTVDGKKYLIEKKPKSGCRKCYGRGYIGWHSKTKLVIPCKCVGKFI